MKVELLHHTPLWVAARAIRKCWASEDKSDTFLVDGEPYHIGSITHGGDDVEIYGEGFKDRELIHRVGNKNKHASTLEHLNYSFDIDGISRACLQELARHRHASLSVKSTRYTLKELKEEMPFLELTLDSDKTPCILVNNEASERAKKYLVTTGNASVDSAGVIALHGLWKQLVKGISNDTAKYCLPESYKTSLVWTVNARSLQNFLQLRTSKAALQEIRNLAITIYEQLPAEHKYLFEEFIETKAKD